MKKLIFITVLVFCGTVAFSQQSKLVVTPFENRGTKLDTAALSNLQDFLINAFINTGRFQVPDRSALELLIKEQQFQLSDWADDQKSAQMGRVLNADYIVRVIAMYDGEMYVLSVRILDVNTASGLSAGEMEFTTQRDARGKMEAFVSNILRRIGGGGTRPTSTTQSTANTAVKSTGTTQGASTAAKSASTPQGASTAARPIGKYNIGDTGPGGGIVFLVDENGGMEVSPLLGRYNFDDAGRAAKNYNGGGFKDWYLPSKDELNQIYLNLQKPGIVDLIDGNVRYWSSSDGSYYTYASAQNFSDGRRSNYPRDGSSSVRAVRAF